MKKLILFLVLPLTLIFAQSNEEEKSIDLTGKFALMFQIDENFDLNSFDGMSFAGKYFFNNELGVRLLISLSYNESDQSENRSVTIDDSLRTTGYDDHLDAVSYRIAPSIIYNLINNGSIRFYIGGGPLISYSNTETSNVSSNYLAVYSHNLSFKSYSIGLNAFFSVEWFVSNNISLSAEYGFEYLYVENERSEIYFKDFQLTDERDQKTDRKIFQSLPVSLGVSIYF